MHNITLKKNFIHILIYLFPILMIIGPFFTNFFSIILSLYAIYNYEILKNIIFKKKKFFFGLLLIILSTFPYNIFTYDYQINLLQFESSFYKFISFLRFLLMSFGIIIFLKIHNINDAILKNTKKIYFFILIIIVFDVLKEHFTGSNIFGFYSTYPGRIASFTDDELIIGFIFAFLVFFSFSQKTFKIKNIYLLSLFSIIFFISFIIGERSNFLKLNIILLIFLSLHFLKFNKFNFIKLVKYLSILLIFIAIFYSYSYNSLQAKKLFNKDFNENIYSIKNNKHIAHYYTAYKIFLNYPIFGIGINNFVNESQKKIYFNENLKFSKDRVTTHPHQIYFEILAEVGLFGFVTIFLMNFLVMWKGFKLYFFHKNFDILGHIMLHTFFIFPILPSGSFFGTNYGLPLWFNFSILLYLIYFRTDTSRSFK